MKNHAIPNSLGAAILLAAIVIAPASADDTAPKGGLTDGWERAVPILLSMPAPEGKVFRTIRGHVVASVDKGWVVVRRETVERDLEWHVVLAQATDPTEPTLRVDEATGALDIGYRGYFVRETADGERLRIYRERKIDTMDWPVLEFKDPESKWGVGGSSSGSPFLWSRTRNFWCWVEGSAISQRPDLWVRLRPGTRRPIDSPRSAAIGSGSGIRHAVGGPVEMRAADSLVQEEGDLFFAVRLTERAVAEGITESSLAEWMLRQTAQSLYAEAKGMAEPDRTAWILRQTAQALNVTAQEVPPSNRNDWYEVHRANPVGAPAIAARLWLNDDTQPLRLHEQLKGRVTIVGFWDSTHAPSVRSLGRLEEIHKTFAGRGAAVLGIHVAEAAETDAARRMFLKEHGLTFPVMMDEADEKLSWVLESKTAKAYGVDVLPAFFLIDKAGRLVRGYGLEPPTDSHIEALLK